MAAGRLAWADEAAEGQGVSRHSGKLLLFLSRPEVHAHDLLCRHPNANGAKRSLRKRPQRIPLHATNISRSTESSRHSRPLMRVCSAAAIAPQLNPLLTFRQKHGSPLTLRLGEMQCC